MIGICCYNGNKQNWVYTDGMGNFDKHKFK